MQINATGAGKKDMEELEQFVSNNKRKGTR